MQCCNTTDNSINVEWQINDNEFNNNLIELIIINLECQNTGTSSEKCTMLFSTKNILPFLQKALSQSLDAS